MKNLLVLLVISLFMVQGINAQSQTTSPVNDKIIVNVKDLTPDQLQKIKEQERLNTMQEKIETYGKWVGVGNEVGIAIKEGLNAVVDVSEKFGNTKVGTFTMYLIAWKVVGKDFIRIFLGIIFQIIIAVLIFKSFKRMFPRRYVTQSRGWKFWLPQTYQIVEPETYDGFAFVKILHIFLLAGSFGLTYAIMFG